MLGFFFFFLCNFFFFFENGLIFSYDLVLLAKKFFSKSEIQYKKRVNSLVPKFLVPI